MKALFDIFKSDIQAIVRYIFVLIIAIALCVLPSLYAWINIYACWDPYVGTGDLEIALASNDNGIDLKDGTHVNSADKVIDDIKDAQDIKYRPMDSADQAIEGVRSGRYYAALVFEDGFTYDMHHFEEAVGDQQPKITYYRNIKNNAVAIKITDSFAEELLDDVNSKYLKAMLTKYFGDAGDVAEELDSDEAVETALEQMIGARDAIHDYNLSVGQLMSSKGDISKALKNAEKKLDNAREDGSSDASKAKEKIELAQNTIDDVSKTVDEETEKLATAVADLRKTLDDLQKPVDEETRKQLVEDALENADRVLTILQNLRGMLPDDPQTTGGRVAADTLDVMISLTEHIKTLLQTDPSSSELGSDAETIKDLLNEDLKPSLELMMTDIEKALERTKPLLQSADGVLDDVDPVLEGAGSTVDGLDSTLSSLQVTLGAMETKLDDAITKLEEADAGDRKDVLEDLLSNDAQQYSELFTDYVEIESAEFCKPVSYGAAMSPFYTILALWVGGVMLVTIMSSNVNRKKFPQVTETQGFFGRYLIFFLIGQIQAAIVIAGNIFLLHVSPVHPWIYWLSAAVTSMVFVILIYALTLSFGDIGRAAVVVIMFLQIAGSSGSFPIEILPGIFDKIYRFFPFPYAIDAMREAMFGLYGHHFVVYLAQLMVFFICAVLIGVFVRKPFIGVKTFMSEKMKETEVM